MATENESATVAEIEKLRHTLKWLALGYGLFWVGLIFGSVALYSMHLLP